MEPSRGRIREVGQHHGGRRWEGKGGQASQLWSNFGHDLKTPATGAVDLDGFAAIPPTPWRNSFNWGKGSNLKREPRTKKGSQKNREDQKRTKNVLKELAL